MKWRRQILDKTNEQTACYPSHGLVAGRKSRKANNISVAKTSQRKFWHALKHTSSNLSSADAHKYQHSPRALTISHLPFHNTLRHSSRQDHSQRIISLLYSTNFPKCRLLHLHHVHNMSLTQRIPTAAWDAHKEQIRMLYVVEDKTLDDTIKSMNEDHGFLATLVNRPHTASYHLRLTKHLGNHSTYEN